LSFPFDLSCAKITLTSNPNTTIQLKVGDIVQVTAVVDLSQCTNNVLQDSADLGFQLIGNATWQGSSSRASTQEDRGSGITGDADLMATTTASAIKYINNIR